MTQFARQFIAITPQSNEESTLPLNKRLVSSFKHGRRKEEEEEEEKKKIIIIMEEEKGGGGINVTTYTIIYIY